MRAATNPNRPLRESQLLVVQSDPADHAGQRIISSRVQYIGQYLKKGDLLVVNDSATFPASLQGQTRSGKKLEIRLLPRRPGVNEWGAALFGEGDWHLRTEDRPAPPILEVNDEILFSGQLRATIVWVSSQSQRYVRLRFNFENDRLWQEIYRTGKPVQYSYLEKELDLWSVQNSYSAKPWATEMPSAGRALNWKLLSDLNHAGIEVVTLTHATGLSSTGDPAFDALLPLPEFYFIPELTALAIRQAEGRVIAIGTSVVRAIEGQALQKNDLVAGAGQTDLLISGNFTPRYIDGILTGIHDVGESHFHLLEAFAEKEVLKNALQIAEKENYLSHEFGDFALVLSRAPNQVRAWPRLKVHRD